MNIEEIVWKCKNKNQQAEKELFFRFAGKVLTVCRRYVRDEHKAKDFMQECFIQIFSQINKYHSERGAFEAWLYKVATNTVLQLLRKSKKDLAVVYVEILPENEMDEHIIEVLSHEEILTAIRLLPSGYRKVFNLFVFEGWSHREIASALGIKESTSQSQLTRAKKMLKKSLEKKISNQYEKKPA